MNLIFVFYLWSKITFEHIPYFLIFFPCKLFFFDFWHMYWGLWSQYINVRKLFKGGKCMQARLWAWGRGDMSTPSFGSHLNSISTMGGRLCSSYTGVHTKFWKPQARLYMKLKPLLLWRFHFAPPAGDLEKELQWLTDVLEIPFW